MMQPRSSFLSVGVVQDLDFAAGEWHASGDS